MSLIKTRINSNSDLETILACFYEIRKVAPREFYQDDIDRLIDITNSLIADQFIGSDFVPEFVSVV